jgi:transcription elongation GreA/GreB family factor
MYIAAALGVMKYNNIPFQVISIQSPLGTALRGHKTGDSITFNQKKYTITELA